MSAAMKRVQIERISVKRNLKVVVGVGRPPRSAEAQFNAVATITPRQFGEDMIIPRFVVVRFRFENDRWLIKDYELFDPRGPQKSP